MAGTDSLTHGVHHVAMRAKDFDASVAFYRKIGFRSVMSWGEGEKRATMLDSGDGNCLELFAGGRGPAPEGVYLHVAYNTDNCDAAIERARSAGAKVTMEPKSVTIAAEKPTAVRIGFCTGPDGEIIEFFQKL